MAEWPGFENRLGRKFYGGSNPPLSATFPPSWRKGLSRRGANWCGIVARRPSPVVLGNSWDLSATKSSGRAVASSRSGHCDSYGSVSHKNAYASADMNAACLLSAAPPWPPSMFS